MPILKRCSLVLILSVFIGCIGTNNTIGITANPLFEEFSNPQRVTILGYSDHAMEPALSRDGRYLFFNNSNDPAVDTNLHWAERIDDLTFQYRGKIKGVNSSALDGVPSMDRNDVLYFITTRSYVAPNYATIYRGTFRNGFISDVEMVPGVALKIAGMVNFDAEISPDGHTLYFVDSLFKGGAPKTADIMIAERKGNEFVRAADGVAVMKQINTGALEYAPAISASGLELFFTRLKGNTPAIYTATRPDTLSVFEKPKKVAAITGFVEAPSLSPDEKALYYHKKENSLFVIYRVTRP
jgi:hypothetical protein